MDLVLSRGCESWWPSSMVPWYLIPPHRPIFHFTIWWMHMFLCRYLMLFSAWVNVCSFQLEFSHSISNFHKCPFSVTVNFILKRESLCFVYMWVEETQPWLAKLSPELMQFVACFRWLLVVVVTPDIHLSCVWVFHNWGRAGFLSWHWLPQCLGFRQIRHSLRGESKSAVVQLEVEFLKKRLNHDSDCGGCMVDTLLFPKCLCESCYCWF